MAPHDLRRDAPRLLRPRRPPRRHGRSTGSRPRCASRRFPRFCGQTFLEATTRSSRSLCVQAYNDWMVEEWCGGVGRPPDPAVPDPAVGPGRWPPPRSAATPAGACGPSRFSRAARATWGCRRSTTATATGTRSSPPATRPARSSACTSARGRRCRHDLARRPAGGVVDAHLRQRQTSMTDWLLSGLLARFPDLKLTLLRGPDRLDPLHPRAAPTRVWEQNRGWNEIYARSSPSRRATYYRRPHLRLLLRRRRGRDAARRHRRRRRSRSRPTTPTPDGTWPHSKAVAEKLFADLDQDLTDKIVRGNTIRLFGLDL